MGAPQHTLGLKPDSSNSLTANHIPLDRAFVELSLMQVPFLQRQSVVNTYNKLFLEGATYEITGEVWELPESRKTANQYLERVASGKSTLAPKGHIDTHLFPHYDKPKKVKDYGAFHALECKKLIDSGGYEDAFDYCEIQEIEPPIVNENAQLETDTNSLESALNRLKSSKWWERKLSIKRARDAELRRIKRGIIGKGKQVYCSDICTEHFILRQQSAIEFMGGLEAVSDDGVVIDMADVIKGSMANPAIRRAELMVRMYGFDQYASEHGHVAEFYTITAPSKYHPSSKKYAGYSPRATQAYLVKLWAKIRAKLKRDKLEVYGLRVVEPHHDSCPHWHLMLFMQDGTQEAIRAIISDYALQEDGNERGAKKHRFTYESIKAGLGRATSYLAKYIAKNIDGHEVGIDNETGELSTDTSTRVRAWSSLHGIRQFQQIGGAPIGVWRELRRVESFDNPLLSKAKEAAENADWKTYLEIQGGALCPRKDQLIKTFSETCIDSDTGEIKQSMYGEFLSKVKGLETTTESIPTRLVGWTIQKKQQAVEVTQASDSAVAWLIGNNCTQAYKSELQIEAKL